MGIFYAIESSRKPLKQRHLLKRGRTETEALAEVDKILSRARVADGTDACARHALSVYPRSRRVRFS